MSGKNKPTRRKPDQAQKKRGIADVDASFLPEALPSRSAGQTPFLQEDDTLLERSRVYWQTGEWDKLAALADENLESYPDRAKLSLLAAVGFAQSGDMSRARRHARLAQEWGCDRELLARVLIGGVYNSLGRAAMLQGNEGRAEGHFEASVGIVSPRSDTKVLARSRNMHEKVRLGMLPEAAGLVREELAGLSQQPSLNLELAQSSLRHIEALLSARPDPEASLALPDILERASRTRDSLPDKQILLCCHHKAGTNFLLKTFRAISEQFDLALWMKFYDAEPASWDICLHQHAHVADMLRTENFRGIHMVRHPMGLIYSAALYHEQCKEPWAHIPMQRFTGATFRALSSRATYNIIKDPDVTEAEKRELIEVGLPNDNPATQYDSGYDFAGRTYAQMLQSFERIEDKVLFEMRAYSRGIVQDMLDFPSDRRFFRIRLEDATHDTQMTAVLAMFQHLGFGGADTAKCLSIAADHSLWNIPRPGHATTGVSQDWEKVFQGDVLKEFRTMFGWAEFALGYDQSAD